MATKSKKKRKGKNNVGEEVTEVFNMYSEEGKLGVEQLQQALVALGFPSTKKNTKVLMQGQPSVGWDEFVTIQEGLNANRPEDREFEQAFDMFDEESRGYITLADLQRAAKELEEKFSDEDLAEMIRVAANEDGIVTYA